LLETGVLSEGHGRAILQVRDRTAQRSLAREVRSRGLSVRETEKRARAISAPRDGASKPNRARRPALVPPDLVAACRELEDLLSAALGYATTVRPSGGGCSVEIRFEDLRRARELVHRLAGPIAA
jgi:ParB family chromosome partitioning protein